MKFELISINLKEIFEKKPFRVDYQITSNTGEIFNINIKVSDFFSIPVNERDVSVPSNTPFFSSFNNGVWEYGFNLIVINNDDNSILFHQVYNPLNKKAWIIGDSHTIHLPDSNSKNADKYEVKKIGIHSLSLNRFISSDYIEFLNNIEIKKQDCLIFYLGEIDIRYTIHKHCREKNVGLQKTFNLLMEKYLECILHIKKHYNNKIVILTPNPPMEDYESDLILGAKEDRLLCQNLFINFWKDKKYIVDYLDWTESYQLSTGFINPDLLNHNDHHINNNIHLLKLLENYL